MSDIAAAFQVKLNWEDNSTGEPQELDVILPATLGRDSQNTVVLNSQQVSRRHARLDLEGSQVVLIDEGSSNGVYVKGQRVKRQPVGSGASFDIRPFNFTITFAQNGQTDSEHDQTQLIDIETTLTSFERDSKDGSAAPAEANLTTLTNLQPPSAFIDDSKTSFVQSGTELLQEINPDFPPEAFKQPTVSIDEIYQLGLPVDQTTYLALGGGLGSFTWVDYLRNSGVDLGLIAVIGIKDKPFERYRQLCQNSQIPNHERLRSDSGSTPDNIWGWPGYAVRETWHDLLRFRLGHAIKVMWTIFGEPTLANTYTPISDDVYRSVEAEARRIGWQHLWRFGRVRAIRKTNDGRYVVAYSQTTNDRRPLHRLMIANYVHLAIGYPGIQFLPDLQAYRQASGDFEHVVNAYEPHDHIYDHLAQHGGTVLVRGRGIVASRIIQRLYEVRRQNDRVVILHLNRSPRPVGNRFGRAGRQVEHHWEFQPFNWPKANWGGDLRLVLEKANDNQRVELYNDWGGSTTADRADWRQIVDTGLKEHWYQIRFGRVSQVERRNGKLVTVINGYGHFNENTELLADFIIDATGLNSSIDSHPLLKDMLDQYNLERNAKGRLQVANDFEVTGMRNDTDNQLGRFYASGVMTLGGPYAPVDSFLGLQYAALRSVDALIRLRTPGLRRLNGVRSVVQWCKWAIGAQP
ncbi:MAG: FHA domain-containing protein [Anaerolineales bacterium]|nr:FHA domain-containing protein [Anaerolineales bacterium]